MHMRTWPLTTLTVLTLIGATLTSTGLRAQVDGLSALDGEWIYVEDRTEGCRLEQLGPPMASTFLMRVEEGAVVLNGHGSGHRDVRVPIDPPAGSASIGIYRQAQDIPLPVPAKAAIGELQWLSGAWTGRRSSGSSIEERWGPPLGGAMFGVSRTVNTSGKLVAFEYLRVVERDGELVYIAQPGGAAPTEFVLTELGPTRAVFDNPRHDYPKRIVYECSPETGLIATVGFTKGGTPRRFEFQREGG